MHICKGGSCCSSHCLCRNVSLPVEQDGVYDAFVEAVTESVGKLKLGSGMDPSTTLGPLINDKGVQRVRTPWHQQTVSRHCAWLSCPVKRAMRAHSTNAQQQA